MGCTGGFIIERIGSPGQSLGCKINLKALGKREFEEFEIGLKHKSKVRIYKELKWVGRFEEYLQHVKGELSTFF